MNEIIEKIVAYAKNVTNPETIILFGSVARNEQTIHSDIDLLILTTDTYYKHIVAKQIQSFAREFGVSADVLLHTPEEIAKAGAEPLSFLSSIVKSGKIIYKKDG